ncbi:MAG: hypothetical protein NZ805_00045 [Armatimonadetes bacterium]|nr:hypothetical protein [Armatimonadota bacterium]MDW8026908.1 hypothetical protein [Armatimonadota bacterium]
MRFWASLIFTAFLMMAVASQEKVQLTLNLMPGGAASRLITGKLKGEWASPKPIAIDLELRSSTFIVIANLTSEGDAIIQVQPQGLQIKGKVGETQLEWTVTPNGDVIAQWQDFKFESGKLPEEQSSRWRKAFTASAEATITPKGRIKSVKMPEFPKDLPNWSEVPNVLKIAHQIVTGFLQTLWLPMLPTESVKVGSQWKFDLPLTMLDFEPQMTLPFNCSLAKLTFDEAVINVHAEHKGELSLSLKRLAADDPKLTIKRGEISVKGEINFLVNMGVPQKARWTLKGEIVGNVEVEKAKPSEFTFRYEAEFDDQLVF